MDRGERHREVLAAPGQRREWQRPRLEQLGAAGAAGSTDPGNKAYDTTELNTIIPPPPYEYNGPS
jgi:hypothetical protein